MSPRQLATQLFIGVLSVLFLEAVWGARFVLDPKILASIAEEYGQDAQTRLSAWVELSEAGQQLNEVQKIQQVNRFFNQIPFLDDQAHWQKTDYWATPLEFLVTNGGDCEDFSIAKYFTLKQLGVPTSKLRLTYVKALELNQAHMVVTYYPTPSSEPWVLDNLTDEIKLASKRPDLLPVYSFNGEGLWNAKERGQGALIGRPDQIGLWKDLITRMQDQLERLNSPASH